jgi:hypothetical protein
MREKHMHWHDPDEITTIGELIIVKDGMEFDKAAHCKGIVFRGHHSLFYKQGVIKEKTELRLLKKQSCPGCPRCWWIFEDLSNELDNLILPDIKQGKLYSIRSVNESRDWETGIIDQYDLEVFEVYEKPKGKKS